MRLFESAEDLRFSAILKRGPTASTPTETLVHVLDVTGRFILRMTVLDASILEDDHPVFGQSGLAGIWTLKDNRLHFEGLLGDLQSLVTDNIEPFKTAYQEAFRHV